MGSYDRMDWHYGGDFPENLPEENGATHIGMYLTWIIENGLIGDLHREEDAEYIQNVIDRKSTGRDFFIDMCDGKFWEDDLNEEGNNFTKYYYDKFYLTDYESVLGQNTESLYEIENSWENYGKLRPILDKRYKEWKDQGKSFFKKLFS